MNKTIGVKQTDTLIFSTLSDKVDRDFWLTYYEQAYVDTKSLMLTYDAHNSFKPHVYYANALPTNIRFEKGNVYYVFQPWMSNTDTQLTKIKQLFRINEVAKVELDGYYLYVYKLAKRQL